VRTATLILIAHIEASEGTGNPIHQAPWVISLRDGPILYPVKRHQPLFYRVG